MDQPGHVIMLQAIAARPSWAGLLRSIEEVLSSVPKDERPFVATSLVEALRRFEDSYGLPGI